MWTVTPAFVGDREGFFHLFPYVFPLTCSCRCDEPSTSTRHLPKGIVEHVRYLQRNAGEEERVRKESDARSFIHSLQEGTGKLLRWKVVDLAGPLVSRVEYTLPPASVEGVNKDMLLEFNA